jgi:hypothetical protein
VGCRAAVDRGGAGFGEGMLLGSAGARPGPHASDHGGCLTERAGVRGVSVDVPYALE